MKRVFDYEVISLQEIDKNAHLNFVCDADKKIVIVEREEENNE